MVTLLLIRHGESEYNLSHHFTGHSDIALTPLGVRQADLTARYLLENFSVDVIWSSDLQRARNTAKPYAERVGLPILLDRDLRETNVGDWQDRLVDDIIVECPKEMADFQNRRLDFRFPNGENSADVYARASRAIARIAEENDGKTVAVFGHGGVIRTLCRHWLGLTPEQFHQAPNITNASVTVVRYDRGRVEFLQIAYDQHLKEAEDRNDPRVI